MDLATLQAALPPLSRRLGMTLTRITHTDGRPVAKVTQTQLVL